MSINLLDAFKCARLQCKTCPFIHNVEKISGPKTTIKITDHFKCTSANVMHLLRNLHLLQKVMHWTHPVVRHLTLPNHSKQHMEVCGLSLHLGSSESRKTLEQKFIFQIGTLSLHSINERFSFH